MRKVFTNFIIYGCVDEGSKAKKQSIRIKASCIMKELEIFLSSDQPATCPKCGNRTDIIKDLKISQ